MSFILEIAANRCSDSENIFYLIYKNPTDKSQFDLFWEFWSCVTFFDLEKPFYEKPDAKSVILIYENFWAIVRENWSHL